MRAGLLRFAAGMVLIALVGACTSQAPVTGRKQFMLMPESQMNAMGAEQYREVIAKSRLSRNSAHVAMLRRVGQRIADAVNRYFANDPDMKATLSKYEWEFNLIEDPQVNAWAMPGGKVAFYTGILPLCQDEAGIAVVMGHEIAHAVAGHGRERLSRALVLQGISTGLAVALSQKDPKTRDIFLNVFGVTANVGVMLPNSREQEYEADYLGLLFMAEAGYDPRTAISFWERMMAQGGAKPPEFLSTHPSDQHRIQRMKEKMPEALNRYTKPVPNEKIKF